MAAFCLSLTGLQKQGLITISGSSHLSLRRTQYSRCWNSPLSGLRNKGPESLSHLLTVTQLVSVEASFDPQALTPGLTSSHQEAPGGEGNGSPYCCQLSSPAHLLALWAVPQSRRQPRKRLLTVWWAKGGTSPKTFPTHRKELRIRTPPAHKSFPGPFSLQIIP